MTYFGKIQISGQAVSDDFFAITDVKTDGLLFYEEIQKPHANLFVQRWNSQPDLLAACEEAEHLICNHSEGNHRAFIECRNDLQQAIAKAKGEI